MCVLPVTYTSVRRRDDLGCGSQFRAGQANDILDEGDGDVSSLVRMDSLWYIEFLAVLGYYLWLGNEDNAL